nr:nucleoporin [Quercus suber]
MQTCGSGQIRRCGPISGFNTCLRYLTFSQCYHNTPPTCLLFVMADHLEARVRASRVSSFGILEVTYPDNEFNSITQGANTAAPPSAMQAPVLYQETRVAPAPSSNSAILYIPTQETSSRRGATSTVNNGAGRKRPFDEINAIDEESYARKHLATEGSVFFRPKSRSPRSFLWRVLNDRQILDVQCVDLVQESGQNNESWLTFRIDIKDGIREHGIVFADSLDMDGLEIFVLSSKCELFTITLKRDLLLKQTIPTSFDPATCVKIHAPSTLTAHRHAYRLFGMDSRDLYVSLADGSFLRLSRKAQDNGTQWKQTIHDARSWKSLRVFSKRHTVRHGDQDIDIGAMAAMLKSPDGKVLWTVSLDHTLRAWSTETWKVLLTMDLLNEKLDKDEGSKRQPYFMNPEQGALLQIFIPPHRQGAMATMDQEDRYIILVHSPKSHEFKMYDVATSDSVEGSDIYLTDLYPTAKLIPPIEELMQTNIWQLDQFHVQANVQEQTMLWITARSGPLCQTFVLTFDLTANDVDVDVTAIWRDAWATVDDGPSSIDKIRHSDLFPGDVEFTAEHIMFPSERWLNFLTHPDRFSRDSLETALHIYRRGRKLNASKSARFTPPGNPLEERLCNAIHSAVVLRKLEHEQPDHERYYVEVQAQWQVLYSLLSHLHNRRNESLSLAFDPADILAWKSCADFIAPLRILNNVEQRLMNTHLLRQTRGIVVNEELLEAIYPEEGLGGGKLTLSRYLAVAKKYRRGLSGAVQESFRDQAALLAFGSGSDSNAARVGTFFESSGLMSETTDQDLEDIGEWTRDFGGTRGLGNDQFLSILEWLDSEGGTRNASDGRVLNRYGVKSTVAIAQTTLQQAHDVLLDLLALLTLLGGDGTDEQVSLELNEEQIFDAILIRLKHNQLLSWLAAHSQTRLNDSSHNDSFSEGVVPPTSLIESIFIGDWRSWVDGRVEETLAELITSWSVSWTYGTDLSNDWDGIVGHIFAYLLKSKAIDLAAEFRKFMSDLAWHQYLQARLDLVLGDYAIASAYFRSAAAELAELRHVENIDSTSLLTSRELEYFGSGPARYFEHVAKLFGDLSVFTSAADFLQLALDILADDAGTTDFSRSLADIDRKKSNDSPMIGRVNIAQEEVRVMKARLHYGKILHTRFKALNETGRFREAFEALASKAYLPEQRYGDLQTFIDKCVKQDAVPTFLALRFEDELAIETDKALAELARNDLAAGFNTLARIPYHQMLYAFRAQRGNFRGASEILYEHLERLRHSNDRRVLDPEDEMLLQSYVLLINTMACCGEDDAWILAQPIISVHGPDAKRKLITLADVRREYNEEMDRRSDVLAGRFPIITGDAMDML